MIHASRQFQGRIESVSLVGVTTIISDGSRPHFNSTLNGQLWVRKHFYFKAHCSELICNACVLSTFKSKPIRYYDTMKIHFQVHDHVQLYTYVSVMYKHTFICYKATYVKDPHHLYVLQTFKSCYYSNQLTTSSNYLPVLYRSLPEPTELPHQLL